MDNNTICKVTNRSRGHVVYNLPERHLRREFSPSETKHLPLYEIQELCATPGGRRLVYHNLYIDDTEILQKDLDITPEPEYYLTEDKIDSWMQTCTLDEFKDALDFAPDGVKDLIKQHAVSLPLNDMTKCKAIQAQLGYNVLQAIKNEEATVEGDEDDKKVPAQRRATATTEAPAVADTGRRTTPKYNVVSKGE